MPKFSVHLRVDEWLEVDTKDRDIAVGAAWDQVFDKGAYDCDVVEVGEDDACPGCGSTSPRLEEVEDEQEAGRDPDKDGGVRP